MPLKLKKLMKSIKLYAAKSVRFRRWSRAGYAVFCSLTCSVTIGCLAVSVSDKSLQKAVGTSVSSLFANNAANESPEKQEEQADLDLAIQQLQEVLLIEKSYESAAACGLKTYIPLTPTVGTSLSRFNRFFLVLILN